MSREKTRLENMIDELHGLRCELAGAEEIPQRTAREMLILAECIADITRTRIVRSR